MQLYVVDDPGSAELMSFEAKGKARNLSPAEWKELKESAGGEIEKGDYVGVWVGASSKDDELLVIESQPEK